MQNCASGYLDVPRARRLTLLRFCSVRSRLRSALRPKSRFLRLILIRAQSTRLEKVFTPIRLWQSREELLAALATNERAREEVEAAARAKDQFLAILSHELRTPLTPVLMAVQTLLRRGDLQVARQEALEMIRRNVQLEARFIDDLLDFTRVSRRRFEILHDLVDVHATVRRALEISDSDINLKDQTCTVLLEAARYQIEGDVTRLEQAIWNLLKNASKFTPKGGKIWVSSRNVDDRIVLDIVDNGIGIEAAAIPFIFDAFSQANLRVAREFGGLGLGLTIAKGAIEAHGGALRASSEGPNQGAKFTLELPLIKDL